MPGLTFLFSNFGANTTTFVIPGEVFPTAARATCHGIRWANARFLALCVSWSLTLVPALFSAACGKLGAAIGAAALTPLNDAVGVSGVLGVCAAVALVGALVRPLRLGSAPPLQQWRLTCCRRCVVQWTLAFIPQYDANTLLVRDRKELGLGAGAPRECEDSAGSGSGGGAGIGGWTAAGSGGAADVESATKQLASQPEPIEFS